MNQSSRPGSLARSITWRLFIALEVVAWCFAFLPFVMCGPAFVVTGTNIFLPQFCLWSRHNPVYWVAKLPLEYIGDYFDVVYFDGEGVATIRPFMLMMFWLTIAGLLATIHYACRRRYRNPSA